MISNFYFFVNISANTILQLIPVKISNGPLQIVDHLILLSDVVIIIIIISL